MNTPKFPEHLGQRGLRKVARHSLAVLLASTALGVVSAHAQDATWNSATGEWVDPTSWTPNTVPSGTATFTNTGTTAVTNNNGIVTIGEVLFNTTAQTYTVTINNPFIVNGTGIVNNSTNTQTFEVTSGNTLVFQNGATANSGTGAVQITNDSGGFIAFSNTSNAGNANTTFTNNSILQFFDTSSASNANITNNVELDFFNGATAGSAGITNAASGTITFNNTASAGTSDITNNGTLQFTNSATAGSGTIENNGAATIDFFNTSSAGSSQITNASGATITFHDNSTAGTTALIINNGTVTFNDSSSAGSAGLSNRGALVFNDSSTAGTSTIDNHSAGTVNFNNNSSAGSANITTSGASSVNFNNSSSAGSANITISNAATVNFKNSSSAGSANITNNDVLNFLDQSTAAGATIVNNSGGTTQFGVAVVGTDTATAGNANITNHSGGTTEFTAATTAGSAVITNDAGGFLQFGDSGAGSSTATAGNAVITNNGNASFNALTTAGNSVFTTGSGGNVFFFDSSTGGSARFITNAGGTFDMSGLTAAGMTAGSIEGAGSYVLGSKSLTVGGNNLSTTVSGVISGISGALTKVGTGTMTLTNTETYTGPTTVNGGALVVDGSIALSSLTTVNAGGTLSGSGIVGNTAITGGTLAPGSTVSAFGPLTVTGNLSFTAASTYMIQVSPTNAGRTNVSGTATLGSATVNVNYLSTTLQKQYTILNSTTGVNGTFNPTVVSNNSNITSTLTYDAHNVFLNTQLNFTPGGGGGSGALTINQQNVANALTGFFNRTGSIPMAFAALSPQGLTIASGELGTGVIQTAIKASDLFLNLLLDPTIAGRSGGFTAQSVTPTGYADEEALSYAARRSGTATDAFAMATKAPMLVPQQLHRWSVWASGYGGSETVNGNAVVGSQDLTARVWGVASGADYKVSPDTLLGFAVGGGGTNYSLANAMGAGRTDMFNAGFYGRQNVGAAYLSGAFAYGWHDVTTNRTVALAGVDMLQGRFQAETFSGRFEGGYRFATSFMGITPYAAAQVISVNLPNYSEVSQNGGGLFALNYASQTTTDTRTELGLRSDKSFAMADGVLTLRGRAAWAHDYDPNRAVTAIFQALPGASFVVNGARPDADSALVSASVERKWLNGFSIASVFEGEFSGNVASYAGKGVVKYSW